ncbi:MAG: hypothetical protein AMXMBFR84_28320 [Candidatus Hydrogenedentota bacterium]
MDAYVAPAFQNKWHEAALWNEISRQPEEVSIARRKPAMRPVGLVAAVLVCVCVAYWYAAPASVWAEALKALDHVERVVVREFHIAMDGAQSEWATAYFETGAGFAVVSPGQNMYWKPDGTLVRFDRKSGKATRSRLDIPPPVSEGLKLVSALGEGMDTELDRGAAVLAGNTVRRIDICDSKDPTMRMEVDLEPKRLLPLEVRRYSRDSLKDAWRLARISRYDYQSTIDSTLWTSLIPADATIDDLGIDPSAPLLKRLFSEKHLAELSQAAKSRLFGVDDSWMSEAAAMETVGESYVAIEDLWLHPEGWLAIKVRTNLEHLFTLTPEFAENEENQRRWKCADRGELNQLCHASWIETDLGARAASNGWRHSRYPDSAGYAVIYDNLYENPGGGNESSVPSWIASDARKGAGASPTGKRPANITMRILGYSRNKGRGESFSHYEAYDTNEPDKRHVYVLTAEVPEPSTVPPASFNADDLEWFKHGGFLR